MYTVCCGSVGIVTVSPERWAQSQYHAQLYTRWLAKYRIVATKFVVIRKEFWIGPARIVLCSLPLQHGLRNVDGRIEKDVADALLDFGTLCGDDFRVFVDPHRFTEV